MSTLLKQDERRAFSERLKTTLQRANASDSPTELARSYNAFTTGDHVTTHAARKWLLGESIPSQEKLRVLSGLLKCDAQWLRFGDNTSEPLPAMNQHDMTIPEIHLRGYFRRLTEHEQKAVLALAASLANK